MSDPIDYFRQPLPQFEHRWRRLTVRFVSTMPATTREAIERAMDADYRRQLEEIRFNREWAL